MPTVEEHPTIVPTIPHRTKSDDALFLPLNSFPFCFFVEIALTDRINIKIVNSPKYIIVITLGKNTFYL